MNSVCSVTSAGFAIGSGGSRLSLRTTLEVRPSIRRLNYWNDTGSISRRIRLAIDS